MRMPPNLSRWQRLHWQALYRIPALYRLHDAAAARVPRRWLDGGWCLLAPWRGLR